MRAHTHFFFAVLLLMRLQRKKQKKNIALKSFFFVFVEKTFAPFEGRVYTAKVAGHITAAREKVVYIYESAEAV